MLVVQRVEDLLAGSALPHEASGAEQAELVRDGRLAEAEQVCDVAHAEFPPRDDIENTDAGRVAENLEGVDETGNGDAVKELGGQILNT